MADKAGIWLRVSTLDQTEEAQYADCAAYTEKKGYDLNPDCVYQIHGASARKGNRKFDRAWAQVIEDIKRGRIKVLIVWRLSRLDRKREAYQMIREVTDYGARIEFAMQPHLNDLSTMAGRISLTVEEEIAYAESEEKSQRSIASIALRRTQGKNTGRYPWGLKTVDGSLVPTELGHKWVPLVFEKIIAGRAPGEVAAMLRTAGIHPTCHTLFIRRMIGNERYRGLLIDPVTWDAANDALNSSPKQGRTPASGNKTLLSPRCAKCGGPMYSHSYRDSRNKFYRCYGRDNERSNGRHDLRGCGGPLIPMAIADQIVIEMFTDDSPHLEWKYIPGDDLDRQIRETRDNGAAAMRRGDYKAAMALMAEAEILESQPRKEAGWKEVPSGRTHREWWETATIDDRRAYLAQYVIRLGKDDTGDVTVSVSLRKRS